MKRKHLTIDEMRLCEENRSPYCANMPEFHPNDGYCSGIGPRFCNLYLKSMRFNLKGVNQKMKKEILLPCPFCGGEARLVAQQLISAYICCTECDMSSPQMAIVHKETLYEIWNKRTNVKTTEQLKEQYEKYMKIKEQAEKCFQKVDLIIKTLKGNLC